MNPSKTLTSAASIASLFTSVTSAHAVINYFDASNGFTVDEATPILGWDIDGDSVSEASIQSANGSTFLELVSEANSFQAVVASNLMSLLALNAGFTVDSGANFDSNIYSFFSKTSGPYYAVGFTDGEAAFIGFRFNPSGTTLYGWAEVVISTGANLAEFEMLRWAYEDSGSVIQVGAIPEAKATSMGLGLLALGAAGLRRWRGARSNV